MTRHTEAPALLRGEETGVFADPRDRGVEKRDEIQAKYGQAHRDDEQAQGAGQEHA